MHKARFLALFLALLVAVCFPQEFRSTLSGRVIDAQQAAVPGAKIIVVQADTGARHETASGADGLYTLPFLVPGLYNISAEASGFKRYLREGVQISTNERKSVDIALELGALAESITVNADAPMLETATASTGQAIHSLQIANMPLNGRTPLVLAQLAFGVTPNNSPQFNRPFDNAGPSGFSMGGAPTRTNELLIDGSPDMTATGGNVSYNPPMDAVAEVKVETFMADAAYGHTGGGTVNVVLKTGANAVHGSAYEFNQASRLFATPFFTNRAGRKPQVTRYNQYGATLSGPVVIPKVIDGRNKVFFYFAYEGINTSLPGPLQTTMPTPGERGGDFSRLLTLGSIYQIYDPATGVVSGTRVQRQPFPGNIIPASRIDPIAKNYMRFFPLPNQPGLADGRLNFLSNLNAEGDDFQNEIGRIDLNLNDRHKLFYNFRHNDRYGYTLDPYGRGSNDPANTNGLHRLNYGATLDDVYTVTPTLLVNTRLSWTRFNQPTFNVSYGFDLTSLGFPASLAAASRKLVLPTFSFDQFQTIGDAAGGISPGDTFQIFETVTKVRGKHSLKMGADLRLIRESGMGYGYSSGRYGFSSAWTGGPLDNSPRAPIGQDFASFLLGLPSSGSWDVNGGRTDQAGYYAFFLQDDLRATSRLTFNLGIRYEGSTPTTERFDRTVNGFDASSPSPIAAQAIAAYARQPIAEIVPSQFRVPGGLLFAGPGDRDIYHPQSHYFSPRFGLAWAPAALAKTVIRGGAGVFFYPLGPAGVIQSGFSQSTSLVPTLNGYLSPAATLANPFPNGIDRPTGSSLGLATFIGKSVTFYNHHPLNPYSLRWDLDVQRELAHDMMFEIGYMGNHSVHLSWNRQLDYVPGQYLSSSPGRDQAAIDRLSANVANPFAGLLPGTTLNGSTIQRQQLLRPFPQFTGVAMNGASSGSSYFHALQMRVEKRFSAGLQFLANYQFSKLIEQTSLLNDSDARFEKRVSADDRPQRFVLSASYELPFGKGTAPALVRQVIGGWVVNTIYSAQSGAPLSWGDVIYFGSDLAYHPRGVNGAFDVTRFDRNPAHQLIYHIRTFPTRFGNLRANGVNNIDFSVLKNFGLTEKLKLQYRCEFFNGFNHPQFNGPNLTPAASSFGLITGQANLPRRIQMALRLDW